MRPIPAISVGVFVLTALVFVGLWFSMPGTPSPLYLEGRVSDSNGRGVSNARIDARWISVSPDVSPPHESTTDSMGRYGISISDAPPKSQLVVKVTTAEGRLTTRLIARPSTGITRLTVDVQLSP